MRAVDTSPAHVPPANIKPRCNTHARAGQGDQNHRAIGAKPALHPLAKMPWNMQRRLRPTAKPVVLLRGGQRTAALADQRKNSAVAKTSSAAKPPRLATVLGWPAMSASTGRTTVAVS